MDKDAPIFFPGLGFESQDKAFESLNIENIEIDLAHNLKFNSIEQTSMPLSKDAEDQSEILQENKFAINIKDDIENLLSDEDDVDSKTKPYAEYEEEKDSKENSSSSYSKIKVEDWKVLIQEPLKNIGNNFSGGGRRLQIFSRITEEDPASNI